MNVTLSDVEPFLGIDPAIWAAIIAGVVTILAAGLGAWVVVWQIGRQARAAIEQNRDNERLKLKLKIYEEVISACTRATDAHIAFTTYVRLFLSGVEMAKSLKLHVQRIAPPTARWPQLSSLLGNAKSETIEFVCFVEQWGVIDPRLEVFKAAFNAGLFDVDQVWRNYSQLAMRLMPMEDPRTSQLVPWDLPPDDEIDVLARTTTDLCNAFGTLTAYASDFQVEAQNLLLADLFGNSVAPRQSLDPTAKVITLAAADELKDYFENQTPWAASARNARARVVAQVEARSTGRASAPEAAR